MDCDLKELQLLMGILKQIKAANSGFFKPAF